MLYQVLPSLSDVFGVFNVFVYISFRAAGALVTSLLIADVVVKWLLAPMWGGLLQSIVP